MSVRVQCAANCCGHSCSCEPLEGIYTCDGEGNTICVHDNRNPATDCMECLEFRRDPASNYTKCFPGRDIASNCTKCLPGRDIASNCTLCQPGYDPLTNCRECLPNVQCQPTQATPNASTATSTSSKYTIMLRVYIAFDIILCFRHNILYVQIILSKKSDI